MSEEISQNQSSSSKSSLSRWARFKCYLADNRKIFVLMVIYVTLFFIISTTVLMLRTQPLGEVKVPNVTGKRFTAVYGILDRKDLNPVLKFYDTFDVEDGIILRQDPQPGEVVSEGDRIKLVVSRSSLIIDMPPLVGKELPIARNMLKNLHLGERTISLGMGVVSYVPSETSGENIVIDQSPKAGEKVAPDQKVNILVSAGKVGPDMTMPSCTGQSIDLCFDLLLSKGVTVTQEVVNAENKNDTGRILEQTPPAGSPIAKGDVVNLKVAYSPADTHFFRGYEKIEYKIGDSDEAGVYEALVEDFDPQRVVSSTMLKPGQIFQFVFQRTGNARVSIMKDKKSIKTIRIDVENF